jgi:ADP-ribose pyrophosphatase
MNDLFDVDGPNPWRTEASRVVFENQRLRLIQDQVIQPDGGPGDYVYVQVRGPIVAIVAVDDDRQVYLVRQWRYPWRANSWEIPSGGGTPEETPLECAQRELAEEVGLCASDWQSLGGGRSSATIDGDWHFFLARGLATEPSGQHARDGSEHDLITQRVPLATAVDAALDGRIMHGMSVVGLVRAARRLDA